MMVFNVFEGKFSGKYDNKLILNIFDKKVDICIDMKVCDLKLVLLFGVLVFEEQILVFNMNIDLYSSGDLFCVLVFNLDGNVVVN